jgi:hypothetical protein
MGKPGSLEGTGGSGTARLCSLGDGAKPLKEQPSMGSPIVIAVTYFGTGDHGSPRAISCTSC